MTRPALTSQARSQPAGRTAWPPHHMVQGSGTAAAAPAVRRADVDARRWPDVARVPSAGPARTTLARYVVGRALDRLGLTGHPVGVRPSAGGARLVLHDPNAFYRRIGRHGLIGFGESYLAGEWDSDDLAGVLTILAGNVDELVAAPLRRLRGLWVSARPAADQNTRNGARNNVRRHYDLSNDLFATFLDPTLTYSSAIFSAFPARFESLAAAQHRKIDRLLDLAGVSEGTRLLEIGTGWGELALRAAARGARVTTLTLSAEQAALARERIAAAGLTERVDVQLRDYRDIEGHYDSVISVEMIEAVGADYWPSYFTALRRALAPGGRIALQAITMGHQRMLHTAATHTFISKYVFPGGLIPSREAIAEHSAAAGLHTLADNGYGEHYAETLRLWRERFTAHLPAVTELGFDPVFARMWEFYLAYSEAGFRSRYLDVRQLLLSEGTHR
ncbi:class I SAM-dependent methyltransferase [Streptomyces sp. CC208A]|uniref:class I SAM-dependent methyltransferase n=1 Tax=Streptomyces sp. CC208A TaxID=3044573 RepID=UPI0024A9D5BD|nr:class I SAM-dependent methyltransferase [Streptomyces sp. CC208A]